MTLDFFLTIKLITYTHVILIIYKFSTSTIICIENLYMIYDQYHLFICDYSKLIYLCACVFMYVCTGMFYYTLFVLLIITILRVLSCNLECGYLLSLLLEGH